MGLSWIAELPRHEPPAAEQQKPNRAMTPRPPPNESIEEQTKVYGLTDGTMAVVNTHTGIIIALVFLLGCGALVILWLDRRMLDAREVRKLIEETKRAQEETAREKLKQEEETKREKLKQEEETKREKLKQEEETKRAQEETKRAQEETKREKLKQEEETKRGAKAQDEKTKQVEMETGAARFAEIQQTFRAKDTATSSEMESQLRDERQKIIDERFRFVQQLIANFHASSCRSKPAFEALVSMCDQYGLPAAEVVVKKHSCSGKTKRMSW
jgi:flagellar biosynthesis GTPase FlhF